MNRILPVLALLCSLLIGAAPAVAAASAPNRAVQQEYDPALCPRLMPVLGGGVGEELAPIPEERMAGDAILLKIKLLKDAIDTVTLSPSGNLVAVATTSRDEKHRLQLWDAHTGRKLTDIPTEGPIVDIAIDAGDERVAAIQLTDEQREYRTLMMRYDASEGSLTREQDVLSGYVGGAQAFSPDGKILAVATENVIDLWDTETGELLHKLEGKRDEVATFETYILGGHAWFVDALAFSADGSQLLSAAGRGEGTVRIWDPATGEHLGCLEVPPQSGSIDALILLRYADGGDAVVAFDKGTHALFTWDAETREITQMVDMDQRTQFETYDTPIYFDLNADLSELLIAAPTGGWVKMLDTDTGEIVGMVIVPGFTLVAQFGADDDTLLTAFSSAAQTFVGSDGTTGGDDPTKTSAERGIWLWDSQHPIVKEAGESQNLLAAAMEQILNGDDNKARATLRRAASLAPVAADVFDTASATTLARVTDLQVARLMADGRLDDALAQIENAIAFDDIVAETLTWTDLCWRGALYGRPDDVLDACDRAVELDPDSGAATDSRGLARALAGDVDGAIADFEAAMASWEGTEVSQWMVEERSRWLAMLYDGGNPFDDQTLLELRMGRQVGWPGLVAEGAVLDLQEMPNAAANTLTQVEAGSTLYIYGRNGSGDWLYVYSAAGPGWVETESVTLDDPSVELPPIPEG